MIGVERLAAIDLQEVLARSALLTRTDRKYLLPTEVVRALVDEVGDGLSVLRVGDLTAFAYESVYFDTPAWESYLASARDRRHRFKVRTRAYLDSGECQLEYKNAGGRDDTIKIRVPYPAAARHELTSAARAFLLEQGLRSGSIAALRPTATTSYHRTTLIGDGFRCTVDAGLRCRDGGALAAGIGDLLVVETKSTGGPTPIDRALWRRGLRPIPFSKYCTGLAALRPELPANKWHRTLRSVERV